jgi:hypothetical protein
MQFLRYKQILKDYELCFGSEHPGLDSRLKILSLLWCHLDMGAKEL